MTGPMDVNPDNALSTRPYLIRALYEWCSDQGFTPYVAVKVDGSVQVPREYVQGDEIVLNISMDATSGLKLGNEFIEFKARFGGKARDIMVPMNRVMAIYARENGQGMAFPVTDTGTDPVDASVSSEPADVSSTDTDPPQPRPAGPSSAGRPALKRVK